MQITLTDRIANAFEIITRAVISGQEYEPPLPKGRQPILPREDDPVESGQGAENFTCAGVAVLMSYVDSKGNESDRRVTLRKVKRSSADHLLVVAYCHERKAQRSFRLDRIQSLTDLQTGEIIEDAEGYLEFLSSMPEKQADNDLGKIIDRCQTGLQVLVYVARADGVICADEMDVLMEYARDCCEGLNFERQPVESYVRKLVPDSMAFNNALSDKSLWAHPTRIERLQTYLARLMDADGMMHEEEFRLGLDIRQAIEDCRSKLKAA